MLNVVFLRGRLTRDPELRTTQAGLAVTNFGLAVQRDYSEVTDFLEIVAWRKTAEFIAKYFRKGQQILIRGMLQTREYTDNDGKNRKAYEVIAEHAEFVDKKPANEVEEKKEVTQDDFAVSDDEELPF